MPVRNRYDARETNGDNFGVWDQYLARWVETEFGEFTTLTEMDAEFMAEQLNEEIKK